MTDRSRARDIGITIGDMQPGSKNAITDVIGVRVGHVSLIEGDDIRTGVTAILPHGGNLLTDKVCAGIHIINAFGKAVGLPQVAELGNIETPILLTNTLNVWTAADALVDYTLQQNPDVRTINPVVGECNDGHLNDIAGRHVKKEHVLRALSEADENNIEEGCVGAGVGTQCFSWKGGIGTSSREVALNAGTFTLGVMTQTNTGRSRALRINGVPIGLELVPDYTKPKTPEGSIMFVIGTDAPLTSRQLTRVARRAAFGLARMGAEAGHSSGDFVIAFSTGNRITPKGEQSAEQFIPETQLDLLFRAAIDATEEAILNALLKAETTTGRNGNTLTGIPIDKVQEILHQYGRPSSL
jgi:D-aminopeptidase